MMSPIKKAYCCNNITGIGISCPRSGYLKKLQVLELRDSSVSGAYTLPRMKLCVGVPVLQGLGLPWLGRRGFMNVGEVLWSGVCSAVPTPPPSVLTSMSLMFQLLPYPLRVSSYGKCGCMQKQEMPRNLHFSLTFPLPAFRLKNRIFRVHQKCCMLEF